MPGKRSFNSEEWSYIDGGKKSARSSKKLAPKGSWSGKGLRKGNLIQILGDYFARLAYLPNLNSQTISQRKEGDYGIPGPLDAKARKRR